MRSLKAREVIRTFEKVGFVVVRQSGSHQIMKHPKRAGTISVPVHQGKDIKLGTLRALIRHSGLTADKFWTLVDD